MSVMETRKHYPFFGLLVGCMTMLCCWSNCQGPATDVPDSGVDGDAALNNLSPLEGLILCVRPGVPLRPIEDAAALIGRADVTGTLRVLVLEEVPEQERLAPDARLVVIGDDPFPGPDALELTDLGQDAYRVRTTRAPSGAHVAVIGQNPSLPGNLGAVYGFLSLLERSGFLFGHPLRPVIPELRGPLPLDWEGGASPRWSRRGVHLHTMHPTELSRVLNGWGLDSPEDQSGFEAQLVWWRQTLLWALANGLNHVHWVLLDNPAWGEFGRGELRQSRLRRLVEIAHEYGLRVGVDAPLALAQQNAFRLIRQGETLEDQLAELRGSVDYLMSAGFDYLMTEAGESEFTHGDAATVLATYDALTAHLDEHHHHKPVYLKVHCSAHQTVEGTPDPRTGEDINFNFLIHYADPLMGALPHTVQHYTMDDPAPTYGNTDFTYIRDFMYYEAGRRPVVWYPETAYWVSFDIDVPLFLPVYALNRYRDLWNIAVAEEAGLVGNGPGTRIDGQFFFSSGWEWGYWLNDVVAARASWQVDTGAGPDDGFLSLLRDRLHLPEAVAEFILRYARFQHDSLILGVVGEVSPGSVVQKNGQAYLQGWETWDDLTKTGTENMPETFQMTQPDRIGLVDTRTSETGYDEWAASLLARLAGELGGFVSEWELLRPALGVEAPALRAEWAELEAGLRVTALRAAQVHGLYDYSDTWKDDPFKLDAPLQAWRAGRLQDARDALDEAQVVVDAQAVVAPVPFLYEWGANPTSYDFNYLWTVKSLYYWWRDEGKAVDAPVSPCYLNIIDAAEVAGNEAVSSAQALFSALSWLGSIDECLVPPVQEPVFPQDDLRSRP